MSLKINLVDDQFPYNGFNHVRVIVRGIVLNEKGQIGLCHVKRNDMFGKCEYLETPGGGKEENESLEEGLIRELDEELGYLCEIITPLGEVNDFYNAIFRKNENHYYLCKLKEKTRVHHESSGDDLISSIDWMSLEEAIKIYSSYKEEGLIKLVKQRELPILVEAKKYLENK